MSVVERSRHSGTSSRVAMLGPQSPSVAATAPAPVEAVARGNREDPSLELTGLRQPAKQRPRSNEAAPEVIVRVTPRLSQATQPHHFPAASVRRRQFFVRLSSLLPQQIKVLLERGEHTKVFVALGEKSGMESARRGDMTSGVNV
jgi:hypothetical protein